MGYKRNVKENIRRKLYANSGNVCAMYGCNNPLIYENTANASEICHIEAVNEDGARYNPNLTDEYVNSYENLILLCPTCHSKIDNKLNEEYFNVNFLKKMKRAHEQSVREALLEKPAIEPPIYIENESFDKIAKEFTCVYYDEIDTNCVNKAIEKVMTFQIGIRSVIYGIVVECSGLEGVDMNNLRSISNLNNYEMADVLMILSEQKVIEETRYINPLDGYEDEYGDFHLVQGNYLFKMINGHWVFETIGKVLKVVYKLLNDKQLMYNLLVNRDYNVLNLI